MASIGQGIDRVDGRLKVAGRAHYAAEFAVPDVVHAVLVQSTIGAGTIIGFDLDAAHAMPGVLAIITPDNAPKLPMKGGPQQMVRSPLLQDRAVSLQRPARRGGRGTDARSGGRRRRAGARAISARGAGHVDGCRAGAGLSTAQRRAPARFASRRSRRRVRHRGGNRRCDLHHADGTSQSDGAARDDRALGRQPTDRVDRDAGHLRCAANPRRDVRDRRVGCACDLPLSRRRLRLQGHIRGRRRRSPRWQRRWSAGR